MVTDSKHNGYGPAVGLEEARQAVCDRYRRKHDGLNYTKEDIILTSGCSHALQMSISGAVSEGEKILLPCPGFSIYHTIVDHFAIQSIDYPLDPDKSWQIDLEKTEALIKEHRPTAWLINNPSNPCGSVYSQEHLLDCLELAKKYRVLVIADEIYEDLVFEGHTFHPMATLSPDYPIITCSGLAKRFMIPGWRLGWVAIHDPNNQAHALRGAYFNLACLILGPCTLVQAALPLIFENVPREFDLQVNAILQENAQAFCDPFKENPQCGLEVILPQGSMYLLIRLPPGTDDIEFCRSLLAAENVSLLPGTVPLLWFLNVH